MVIIEINSRAFEEISFWDYLNKQIEKFEKYPGLDMERKGKSVILRS